MLKKIIFASLSISTLLLSSFGPVPFSRAASASIVFGPGSLSVAPGGKVSTTLMLASDVSVNSIDFSVTFPASLVSAVSVDTSGTAFPAMFMGPPTIDNGAGTVHFLQSKVGGTTSGKIATITFQAKASGNGSLGIKNGKVIANDGNGTNVYSGTNGASISSKTSATPTPAQSQSQSQPQSQQSFRPLATTAPAISSSTHPDQEKWYNTREVKISWTGGGSGYNVAFDQDATTQLPEKTSTSESNASTTLAADGIWFAHVKTLGSAGWGPTSHFRLQADTKIPAEFTPKAEPAGHGSVMPKITFSAHDDTSGIDHYELRVDKGSWARVTSPTTLDKLEVGPHTIQVKAVDKAGNDNIGEVNYTLDSPDPPVITFPQDNQLFVLGQSLSVKGKADPNVTVDIYLNDKKTDTVKTDEDGNFESNKKFMLFAGAYKLVAKAISPDGIISPPSDPVSLTIDAKAVKLLHITLPGWLAFTLAGVVFGVMLLIVMILLHRIYCLGHAWKRRVGKMQSTLNEDLDKLEAQLDHEVDEVLAGNLPQAEAVKEEVAKAVAEVQQNLEAVGEEMLAPEPWMQLPILHGSERFAAEPKSEEKREIKAIAEAAGKASVAAAVKDASIAFAVNAKDETKEPVSGGQGAVNGNEAQIPNDKSQMTNKEQGNQEPKGPQDAQEAKEPASGDLGVVSGDDAKTPNDKSPEDQTPNDKSQMTNKEQGNQEPKEPQDAQEAKETVSSDQGVADGTGVEEAADEPEIEVDMFAPKISEAK